MIFSPLNKVSFGTFCVQICQSFNPLCQSLNFEDIKKNKYSPLSKQKWQTIRIFRDHQEITAALTIDQKKR